MPGPGLIQEYQAAISARLPGRIAEELAGGLDDTYRSYLGQGLSPDAAARAAVAEFGEPEIVAAAFTRSSPSRRIARQLLAIGPAQRVPERRARHVERCIQIIWICAHAVRHRQGRCIMSPPRCRSGR